MNYSFLLSGATRNRLHLYILLIINSSECIKGKNLTSRLRTFVPKWVMILSASVLQIYEKKQYIILFLSNLFKISISY